MQRFFNTYYDNGTNFKRQETDSLFILPEKSIKLSGRGDSFISFVEQKQLLDERLWKLFADQFRHTPDDEDLGWRGEFWGKMMRGAVWTYQYNGSEQLYGILTRTVKDLLTAQDDLGRLSTYSRELEFSGWDIWGRKYVMLGLQYYYGICKDSDLKQQILRALTRQADYIIARIGTDKIDILKTSHFWGGVNSASILEAFVLLYNLTGQQKYLDFSGYIIGTGGCLGGDLIELACEGKLSPYQYPQTKAYETMSFFEGVLEYYRITGEEKYRIAVCNFISAVKETDITVIGCAGCTHELFDNSGLLQTEWSEELMQETCVTVTWMKLNFQYLCFSGDAAYADNIEQSMYNAFWGALNVEHNSSVNHALQTKEGFLPFDSYSPLCGNVRGKAIGGFKRMGETVYGCCASIGSAGTGLLGLFAAMGRKDGVAVNFYESGVFSFITPKGATAHLKCSTNYPFSGGISFALTCSGAEKFCIALRRPQWCSQMQVVVNGKECGELMSGYICISREWKDGDRIEINLQDGVRVERLNGKAAFLKGPIVLALDERLGQSGKMQVKLPKDGAVRAEIVQVGESVKASLCVNVHLEDGKTLKLVDYASAGQDWDDGNRVSVWLSEI